MTAPRVAPRPPVRSLLARPPQPDPDHPSYGEPRSPLSWAAKTSLGLLAVFWTALPIAGLLVAVAGPEWALCPLGLAVASLVVAWLLGAE